MTVVATGTAPVAWTGEDLDALPVGAVVNSHVTAARKAPGSDGVWACTDGVVRTSTELAPWKLVPANDKYFARLEVLRTLATAVEAAL